MDDKRLFVNLLLKGSVLSMPAEFAVEYHNSGFALRGIVCTQSMRPENIIDTVARETQLVNYLGGKSFYLPDKLFFQYENGESLLYGQNEHNQFGIVWSQDAFACLVSIKKVNNDTEKGLEYYISEVAEWLCIEQIYLLGKRGSVVSLPLLSKCVLNKKDSFQYPKIMDGCDILFCGEFSFDKTRDKVGEFLYEAFGIENTSLLFFMGMKKESFKGYVMLPKIEGQRIIADELYVGVGFERGQMEIVLEGTFHLLFLNDITFMLRGKLGTNEILLETNMQSSDWINIISNIYIKDPALAIAMGEAGLAVRIMSNIKIGSMEIFGSVGAGTGVEFVAASVSNQASFSKLIENIFGNQEMEFLKYINFIKFFDLKIGQIEKSSTSENRKIISDFNTVINDTEFSVDEKSVSFRKADDGIIMLDHNRVRSYFINAEGELSIPSQFYFSAVNTRFGKYTLYKGTFVCANITLFDTISLKALFMMSEEGMIAFANIGPIDFGIFSITSSGIKTEDDLIAYFKKGSLLWLFLNAISPEKNGEICDTEGSVFFLRAGKEGCSFYIDGKIQFLTLVFQARLTYINGWIYVNEYIDFLQLCQARFLVKAELGGFSKASFKVQILFDARGLKDKLSDLGQWLNDKLQSINAGFENKIKELEFAQKNVNLLFVRIGALQKMVDICKEEIDNATGIFKPLIILEKAAEVALLEVSIMSLHALITVANEGLELLKMSLEGVNDVIQFAGSGVDGIINGIQKLFFVNYFQITADASAYADVGGAGGEFRVDIDGELMLLGQVVRIAWKADESFITGDLIGNIINKLKAEKILEMPDVKSTDYKSMRRQYVGKKRGLGEYEKLLKQGMTQLNTSSRFILNVEQQYVKNGGEMPFRYQYVNQRYDDRLREIEETMGLVGEFSELLNMKQLIAQDGQRMDKAYEQKIARIENYKRAGIIAENIKKDIEVIKEQRSELERYTRHIKEEYVNCNKSKGGVECMEVEKILNSAEKELYETFMPLSYRNYINPAREGCIIRAFEETRQKYGINEPEEIVRAKDTPIRWDYKERL